MYVRQTESSEEARPAHGIPPWERAAYGAGIAPELEDARRRFVLALRALTVKRERDERNRAAIEEWAQTLEQEIRAYRKWRWHKLTRRLSRLAILLAVTVIFFRHNWFGSWWIWVFFGGGSAAADVAAGQRKQAATALARARDPRAVNVLAIAARDGDGDTREVARQGLKSIMPAVRPGDGEALTPQGWDALLGILTDTKQTDADLLVAILRGLEQIGDARAIPAVEKRLGTPLPLRLLFRLAARYFPRMPVASWSVTRELLRVQDAARQCLPFLQARAEEERARTRLLRPAIAPGDPATTLLRPAEVASDTSPEQLLRPVEGA